MFSYHGDTLFTIDASTGDTYTYDYDAYGNQVSIDATDENPFRYCGEYYDSETGLIYLRARYYDTTTGRFTQEDPARDGLNWYVYCAGNPLMYVDPWGEEYRALTKLYESYKDFFGNSSMEHGQTADGKGYVVITLGEYCRTFYYDGTIMQQEYNAADGISTYKSSKIADNSSGKLYMQRNDFVNAMGMFSGGAANVYRRGNFYVSDEIAMMDFVFNAKDVLSMPAKNNMQDVEDALGFIRSALDFKDKIFNTGMLYEGNYNIEIIEVNTSDRANNTYSHRVITIYGTDEINQDYQYYFVVPVINGDVVALPYREHGYSKK